MHLLGTPFFSTKDEGTGMGLTHVFSTVYQHGATIDVESRKNEGTRFTIIFPLEMKLQFEGVSELDFEYIDGQGLREFITLNLKRIEELFSVQAKNSIQQIQDQNYEIDLLETMKKIIIEGMVDEREHQMALIAKERGKNAARNDIPLIFKIELIQTLRMTYLETLHYYYR